MHLVVMHTLKPGALAMLHKPTDPAALCREARALIGLGLSLPDAAQALGMTPTALADLLALNVTAEGSA